MQTGRVKVIVENRNAQNETQQLNEVNDSAALIA
jgi:bifunctional N-acetylglucosamine-1-phosphate-uridyltransferase/glucosamine-1-phosphate-acetyltransferase GlmU-like protein